MTEFMTPDLALTGLQTSKNSFNSTDEVCEACFKDKCIADIIPSTATMFALHSCVGLTLNADHNLQIQVPESPDENPSMILKCLLYPDCGIYQAFTTVYKTLISASTRLSDL